MLDRIGVLEDDGRTLRGIVAELVKSIREYGFWQDETPSSLRCTFCDGNALWKERDYIDAIYAGDKPFPHTDACAYAAGLRIAQEASHDRD